MRQVLGTDDPHFVKDPTSKAILNIDNAGYERFKSERAFVLKQQQLEETVHTLQQDVKEFKDLLKQLINRNTNGKINS